MNDEAHKKTDQSSRKGYMRVAEKKKGYMWVQDILDPILCEYSVHVIFSSKKISKKFRSTLWFYKFGIRRVRCRFGFGYMKQASALCALIWLQGAEKGTRDTGTPTLPKYCLELAFQEALHLICHEKILDHEY